MEGWTEIIKQYNKTIQAETIKQYKQVTLRTYITDTSISAHCQTFKQTHSS